VVRFIILSVVFAAATVLTQVGGIILVGSWMTFRHLFGRCERGSIPLTFLATICLYGVITFALIPPIAQAFGRTALPLFPGADSPIGPRSIGYCILNRHYVSTDLAKILDEVAGEMADKYPGITIHYLDANFPFINGFPLLPHLSHRDGRKIDFTFFYRNANNRDEQMLSPSPIGYWVYEPPKDDEPAPYVNQSCLLRWDFDILQNIGRDRLVDLPKTHDFLRILLEHSRTDKVLLELHLHSRFGFPEHPLLKFQQCNAARHDDHLHFQIGD